MCAERIRAGRFWSDRRRPSSCAGVRRARQRGSLLLEFMVLAVLGLALAVWAGQEWAQRVRVLQAQALAAWMETAQAAAQAYLQRHAAELGQAVGPDALAARGYADWRSPTWEELRAASLLPAGWQDAGPLRQTLNLSVQRTDPCIQAPCVLQAVVAAAIPLRRGQGGVDESLVAEWLLASRGRGLVVWPRDPGWLSGPGRRVPLPAGLSAAPGTVALLAALAPAADSPPPDGAAAGADYLRVRDERDPDFQGEASVRGNVRSGAWLQAREGLVLEQAWSGGAACAAEGAVGRDSRYAGLLVCQQGRWRPLARPAGGGYLYNSRRGCFSQTGMPSGNPVTGTCSCGAGYIPLLVAESGSLVSAEGLSQGIVCQPNQ